MQSGIYKSCVGRTVQSACLLAAIAATAARGQVIPAERAFTNGWRQAGYPGEIPSPDRIVNVRDYGALGNGSANDAPAIQAAVAALGADGGVVYFPAGTYAVPNHTIFLPSKVVLRGERSHNTTILATNLLATQTAILSVFGQGPSTAWMDILAGYDLKSRTIQLADVSAFSPGDWIETHQGEDPAWDMSAWPDMIGQILKVDAVTVTNAPAGILRLASPLRLQYQPGLPLNGIPINPQVRRFDRTVSDVGIENLRFARLPAGDANMRNNVPSIYFRYAVNCWVRGCEFTNLFGSAVSADYSAHVEITGNDIHDAYEFDGGGSGYGVCLQFRSSAFLVENNIFRKLRHSMLLQAGANGNVFGYNYSRDLGVAYLSDMTGHGNYPYGNLFEGNCGHFLAFDSSHGANGPHNTVFRNRLRGTSYIILSYALSITDTIGTNQTFVGNEVVGPYSVNTPGTFEYGNNDDGVIKPSGTGVLPDYSYYLGDDVTLPPPLPDWWNIGQSLPVYGPLPDGTLPPIGTERDIPARARYFGGGAMTYGPPSLYRQPADQVADQGSAASFTVGAVGTPVARFQWYRDDTPVPGATNAVLTIASVQPGDAGEYRAEVSDDRGRVWSAPATLEVQAAYVTVTATALGNGTITPSGQTPVLYGSTTQWVVSASHYYEIQSLKTNSIAVAAAAHQPYYLLSLGPLTGPVSVIALFVKAVTSQGVPADWLGLHGYEGTAYETEAGEDWDKDGHLNWMEYLAGTDPTNRGSVLRMDVGSESPSGGGGVDRELRWSSATGRHYGVWWTTNLAQGFSPLATGVAAETPINTHTHANAPGRPAFYQVRLESD